MVLGRMVPVLLCGLSLLTCMWCPATYYPMGQRERVSQKMSGLFLLPYHPTTVSVTITSCCCTPSCDVHSIVCSGRAHSSIPQEHHPSPEVVYAELACSFSPVGIGPPLPIFLLPYPHYYCLCPVPAPGSRLSLAPQSPVASTQVDMMALKGDNARVWMKAEAGR